jgi:DNA-directed RNA polymerase subunit H (RpoH/RPB5)
MQVSDAGQLLRSTLQATKILIELRGMVPIMRTDAELDVKAWLKRREALEDLDEDLFEEAANTFVAELLDHDHKRLMLGRVEEVRRQRVFKKKQPKSKSRAAQRRRRTEEDADEEPTPEEEDESVEIATLDDVGAGLHMHGNVYVINRLVSNHNEFLPHLYPLVFGCITPPAQRPHALLDYRLAIVVHSGRSAKIYNETLKTAVESLERLRMERGVMFGYAGDSAALMPCRIFVVLWGAAFHPKTGAGYSAIQAANTAFNKKQVANKNFITVEAWSVVELQFDVTEHEDVGAYTVVNDITTVPELRTVKTHQFAYIRENDAQARVRDLRVNQVVRIDRTDFDLAGKSHDYRVVVPHDFVLEKHDDKEDGAEEAE